MKQSFCLHILSAASLILFSGHAAAQSALTLYGIVDLAIERASSGAGTSVTRMVSGQAAASRLGFRAVEDLGGGLSAILRISA